MTIVPLFPIQGRFCEYCMDDDHGHCADEACACAVGPHPCRPKRLTPIAACNPKPEKPSALPRRRPIR